MTHADKRIPLVFIGQRNFYTDFLTDWLAGLTDLRGVIWTASDRHTGKAKRRRLWHRMKRYGPIRVASEVLYYLLNRKHGAKDEADLRELITPAREEMNVRPASAPTIEVLNLRTDEVNAFLDKCDPDVILTQCINEIVPESVFSRDRIGCFVYHEGVVPKYRGKFCTFWAILNREYDQIGASLIKIGRGLDVGQVAFVEHVLPAGLGHRHQWWEHEVLYLALPRLKKWIGDVSAGRVELKDQGGFYPIFSYPRFRHIFKIGRRVREYERWRCEAGRQRQTG